MLRDGDPPPAETSLDEDDRLKPSFVRAVLEHVEGGEAEAARALVRPLHPADIADLFELADRDERAPLAAALGELLTADALSEMNDYVREDIVDVLAPEQVAVFASALDTDDAVAIIEDMDRADQRPVLDALDPEDRAAIEET